MAVVAGGSSRRNDNRLRIIVITLLGIAIVGGVIKLLPGDWTLKYRADNEPVAAIGSDKPEISSSRSLPAPQIDTRQWQLADEGFSAVDGNIDAHAAAQKGSQLSILFEHGVMMLQKKSYDRARKALQGVLLLAPEMPEGHVNLGYAELGMNAFDKALESFQRAVELNPMQSNAYYGMALCYESQGDLEFALGAMRSFLHLSEKDGFYAVRARSALWEWEELLERRALAEKAVKEQVLESSSTSARELVPDSNAVVQE